MLIHTHAAPSHVFVSVLIHTRMFLSLDFAFGKCLPQYGLEPEELFREPLAEEQVKVLRAMLEELQGANLGWRDPFVQCRMQGALYALRTKTDLPANMCAPLAPEPMMNAIMPEAFIRFAPPQPPAAADNFANEMFYPPLKKNSAYNSEDDNDQLTMQPAVPLTSRLIQPHHSHHSRNQEVLQELLRPPSEQEFRQELPEYMDYPDNNLPPSHFKERQEILEEEAVKDLLDEMTHPRTSFREVSQSYHIPQQHLFAPQASDYVDDVQPDQVGGGGIYTEGGVVYPEQGPFDSKEEARNILADMLGFTRHERLDVKKPGPVIGPPPNETVKAEPSEVKPVVADAGPKTKKVLRDDKAPHVVDTDFAHVRIKNP